MINTKFQRDSLVQSLSNVKFPQPSAIHGMLLLLTRVRITPKPMSSQPNALSKAKGKEVSSMINPKFLI